MRRLRREVLHAVVLMIALVGAACGGNPDEESSRPTETPNATSTATGVRVTATMTDYAIDLSTTSFRPGRYTFVARQAGQAPHAISIRGPGVETASTRVVPAGGSDELLTVTLQAGTYELWCPVGNHRQQGMEVEATVR